jgi:hypothetical protein
MFGWEWRDQAEALQAGDGTVERAGAEVGAGEGADVLDHGVAVLWTVRQTDQDE